MVVGVSIEPMKLLDTSVVSPSSAKPPVTKAVSVGVLTSSVCVVYASPFTKIVIVLVTVSTA